MRNNEQDMERVATVCFIIGLVVGALFGYVIGYVMI